MSLCGGRVEGKIEKAVVYSTKSTVKSLRILVDRVLASSTNIINVPLLHIALLLSLNCVL
jgi:hypothetical protein